MLVLLEVKSVADAAELMADARCQLLATAETRGEMQHRISDLTIAEVRRKYREAAGEFGAGDLKAVPFSGILRDRAACDRLRADLEAQTHGAVFPYPLPVEGDPDDDEQLNPPTIIPIPGRDDGDEDGDAVAEPTDDWTDAPGGQNLGVK